MFKIFWQVWIGELGKKDYQNAKKIKYKQIVNDRIYEEFRNLNVYIFLEKYSMCFQNSLIKSLIHKFLNLLTSTDRRNWKENVKNKKKTKKKIVNRII